MRDSGTLKFYRLGSFYEAYGADAETAARLFQITLTGRNINGSRINSVGIPDSAAEQYEITAENHGYEIAFSENNPYITSVTEITDEDINNTLIAGSGFEKGKQRIIEFFEKNSSLKERADFLKKEYGTGGRYDGKLGVDFNASGLHIIRGNIINPDAERHFKWTECAKRIDSLIKDGNYVWYDTKITEENKISEPENTAEEFVSTEPENSAEETADQETVKTDAEDLAVGDVIKLPPIVFVNAQTHKETVFPSEYGVVSGISDGMVSFKTYADEELTKPKSNSVISVNRLNRNGFEIVRQRIQEKENDRIPDNILNPQQNEMSEQTEILRGSEQTAESKLLSQPEQTTAEAENFHIVSDNIRFTKPEQFKANIEAVKILKTIENENRTAAPDERLTLSKYAGWGGLADYFAKDHTGYNELKNILTDAEYSSARKSALDAFYTPNIVIENIYSALSNMGFRKGNILEPSMGIGRFFGMLPENMRESKLYGAELDDISGRIAKQLYPNANIQIRGFEKTNFPDGFFDIAVGNVPFGNYGVNDSAYNKYHFMVHDYFIAKTIDKLRPGGAAAVITSKGTMDKVSDRHRKYFALKAELIGAVRLPDNAFNDSGTKTAADILFFRKRGGLLMGSEYPDWVNIGTDNNGFKINQYFVDNPDMILGEMREVSTAFGLDTVCKARENDNLSELLNKAVSRISADYTINDYICESTDEPENEIPVIPDVRNYSYAVVGDNIYYRENDSMRLCEYTVTAAERIKGMCGIRDTLRGLISVQLDENADIIPLQTELNKLYDDYTAKYGFLNDTANRRAFSEDSGAPLLLSLENFDGSGRFISKSDIFTKRTIKAHTEITKADSASEALGYSISKYGGVNIKYMADLCGKSEDEIIKSLRGIIYKLPLENRYVTADEYLSGDIKNKIAEAKLYFDKDDENREININALEKVIPEKIKAEDIEVRLGSAWIPPEVISQFIYELLETPDYYRRDYSKTQIKAEYSPHTSAWNISNKRSDSRNIRVNNVYGTNRMNAYEIIEQTLNLRDVKVYDYTEENGRKKAVLNAAETTNAQNKQNAVNEKFDEWIWKDRSRRVMLEDLYNDKFNRIRPREYDGSHIEFSGMNPEIKLRPHQINAVARGLYGGNTLLAHVVGAGKSYEMAAIAMERKKLGMCSKSLFVVPNHLTEQLGADFLKLYPGANVLAAGQKDFEKNNRRRLCAKIAAGNYDAVIIGHSQLMKIPVSSQRQIDMIQKEIDRITDAMIEAKEANGGRDFTVKQLAAAEKRLQVKMEKLINEDIKDNDNVTFEELGIDALFVDEAHLFKNLYFQTKMSNISGIPNNEVQKTFDLMLKCQYMDEITGGRGIIFATGTPISNSITEMYTMQRYLQSGLLKKTGLDSFDMWASTFGKTVTEIGLCPEGTGYRPKTRFAKFFNLPELMTMFRETADIQTADMLRLPIPKAEYTTVTTEPSEEQRGILTKLAQRADDIRKHKIDSSADNMLCVTNDGRKMALDQRLFDENMPDNPDSKINICVKNVFDIWRDTEENRSAQILFCDMSTPKKGGFDVYNDVRNKLISMGVPKEETAFIHEADSEAKKKALFAKVRAGDVRVIIGSTAKMGAGTNVRATRF